MKRNYSRILSLLLMLTLMLGLLSGIAAPAEAATVNYVYSGKYIYNWGHRGTTATFLSPNAEKFYQDNQITYESLSALAGASSVTSVPSSDLYKALKQLMASNHSHITDYGETRNLYKYTDCQDSATVSKTISSFYSGVAIGPVWDGGSTWNREHTWPNSKGLGGNDENDIMMLRPTAKSENGSRSNRAYGQSSGYYDPNMESGGKYDVRGDVARIFLYVYVRWGNVNGNGKYTAWGSSGVMESRDVLLEWMYVDPVDTWELGRNDSVESLTGTRNVFVDYPELAFLLFGEEVPENMTTPSKESRAESADSGRCLLCIMEEKNPLFKHHVHMKPRNP
jgi:endonuclease I